jgi:subtilisin family serine protease
VHSDLDAFLLDAGNNVVRVAGSPVFSHNDNIGDTQQPFELLSWENTGPEQDVRLVINRFAGSNPRLKFALQGSGSVTETEYDESEQGDVVGPLVFGQPGAASAIGVGAVPFNDSTKPEDFSSPGAVKHFFGPVVGSAPAALIAPQEISKPDFAATDGGATTFFSQQELDGIWRFFGTLAATPHAAAVMALMRQANPTASAAQLRTALAQTARKVGAFGPTAVGTGLIDAFAA